MNWEGMLEEAGVIEGFPRIDRFFPECRTAAIEAAARFRFGIADFGKAYANHTFRYRKPAGPIRYRSNGVELELELHRAPMGETELDSRIEELFGLRSPSRVFRDVSSYWEYCVPRLRERVPVVTEFNLGFIKERREYGKVFSPHVIVLHGYDARARTVVAAEQMIGQLFIERDEFTRCLEHTIATEGAATVWDVIRTGQPERSLESGEVLASAESNLANLTSSEEGFGLGALRAFRDDLRSFLEGPCFGPPFSVPGLWVFSHERHIQRKWLAAVRPLCATNGARILDEFDAVLGDLHRRWLAADYLIEKCLLAGTGQPLRTIPGYLDQILEQEGAATRQWEQLHSLITRA